MKPELTSVATEGLPCTFVYNISKSSVKQNLRDLTLTLMGNCYIRTTSHLEDGDKRVIIIQRNTKISWKRN